MSNAKEIWLRTLEKRGYPFRFYTNIYSVPEVGMAVDKWGPSYPTWEGVYAISSPHPPVVRATGIVYRVSDVCCASRVAWTRDEVPSSTPLSTIFSGGDFYVGVDHEPEAACSAALRFFLKKNKMTFYGYMVRFYARDPTGTLLSHCLTLTHTSTGVDLHNPWLWYECPAPQHYTRLFGKIVEDRVGARSDEDRLLRIVSDPSLLYWLGLP